MEVEVALQVRAYLAFELLDGRALLFALLHQRLHLPRSLFKLPAHEWHLRLSCLQLHLGPLAPLQRIRVILSLAVQVVLLALRLLLNVPLFELEARAIGHRMCTFLLCGLQRLFNVVGLKPATRMIQREAQNGRHRKAQPRRK